MHMSSLTRCFFGCSLLFLFFHLCAHIGVIEIDQPLLAATVVSFAGTVGFWCFHLSYELDREKRRISKITDSMHRVLQEHERRLPPLN